MPSPSELLSFEQARERIVSRVKRLSSERVLLGEAHGRVLGEDLHATSDLPAFDYSAMDGYALSPDAIRTPGPWRVLVSGESRTGHPVPELDTQGACRIFTGARLPAGTDRVLIQENARQLDDHIEFDQEPKPGEHVRRRGEDLKRGSLVLERGTRLGALQLGVAAALDHGHVPLVRRPRVVILRTGDELRPAGSPAMPGSIPDSNGPALAALVHEAGGRAELGPLLRDDAQATRDAIEQALRRADLLVTVGGVSVGDHDVVKAALEAAGARIDFWKVRIKPGKPLVFGEYAPAGPNHADPERGQAWILGLPGNPVSAQLTFSLFGLPLLRQMLGVVPLFPTPRSATVTNRLQQKPGRLTFARGRWANDSTAETPRVEAFTGQSSGSTLSLAQADVLILIPAQSEGFQAGDAVEVLPLAEL